MSRAKERPKYQFIRRGNSLVPEMEYDLSALDGIAQNEAVMVELKKGRSNPRLRAYWSTLRDCIDATGCAPNIGVLHNAVKLNTGHVDYVRLGNGYTVAVPSSIAFDSMDEQEMVVFFRSAEQWLAEEYGFFKEPNERNAA